MKVALRALKRRSPREIVAALPVAPPDTITDLAREADRIVCLERPVRFRALGYYYLNFPQLTDEEVNAILQDLRRQKAGAAEAGDERPRKK